MVEQSGAVSGKLKTTTVQCGVSGSVCVRARRIGFLVLVVHLVCLIVAMPQGTDSRFLPASGRSASALAGHINQPRPSSSDGPSADGWRQLPSRREDYDADGDGDGDGDVEGADHNAAASFRTRDEGRTPPGESNDGYEDNERDGPYEETPVEQEGQADLERFFDDHLGASEKEGMDKENLPSELRPTFAAETQLLKSPSPQTFALEPLEGPRMQAGAKIPEGAKLSLSALPSDQRTQIIRLPAGKKLIVTNQIVERTRVGAPLAYEPGGHRSIENDGNTGERGVISAATKSHGKRNEQSGLVGADHETRSESKGDRADNGQSTPRAGTPLDSSEFAHATPVLLSGGANQAGQRDARDDNLSATGSHVVVTEDDDYDRIYITNATNKPFLIDALGGYDPEADFRDAAEELEPGRVPRIRASPARAGSTRQEVGVHGLSRASSEPSGRDEEDDGEEDGEESRRNEMPAARIGPIEARPRQFPGRAGLPTISGPVDRFEDASETDEITFGQDDPYQTDLEAEMRLQDYDRVGKFQGAARGRRPASTATGDTNKLAPSSVGEQKQQEELADEVEELDTRIQAARGANSEGEPSDDGRKPSPNTSVLVRPTASNPTSERRRDETDDEGGWINDGIDEMDIPSQSHQNFILDKAAKQDELARRANKQEAEEVEEGKRKPTLEHEEMGEGEGGTTNDDASEESQRMPNADYMKNDLIEDDSGYAA